MELNHIGFSFELKEPKKKEMEIYSFCCFWLGIMYKYYMKTVLSEKMRLLEVILTENSESRVEEPISKYNAKGEYIYLYIKYEHKNLVNKPFTEVQKILLDIIHNRIIEYVIEKKLDKHVFQEAYNSVIENNFLFEQKHLNPVSNNVYTAQLSFKFDFQNTGIFYNWIFVEIYKKTKLIKKIKLLGDALFAIRPLLIEKDMEWIDEENIKVFLEGNYNKGNFYWKVNINGTIEYDIIQKNDPEYIFSLGIDYYKGYMIAIDKTKGYELIKKAAEMGYYSAVEWMRKYNKDSNYPFWIPPKNY